MMMHNYYNKVSFTEKKTTRKILPNFSVKKTKPTLGTSNPPTHPRSLIPSVTRFGEISPLWQKKSKTLANLNGLYSIWHHFVPNLFHF